MNATTDPIPKLLTDIEELHPVRSAGVVRLPELIGVPFTDRVRRLVDHPHFQRLRKVRQLSLAYLVYPGAVHTRFEHSLGVLETTTRYLTALLTQPDCRFATDSITRGEVESLLLAALLHDIGHYPFAHLMEDLYGEVADHIDLVKPFLDGTIGDPYPSLTLPPGIPPLGEIIAEYWPNAALDDICYFVSGETGGNAYTGKELIRKSMLRSILDGSVDADKMDYLYRDSIHCGVPYGRFIDRDRFFQALTVSPERPDAIGIHEKGRISVELFAYARSAMYSEVYWHHSSRAVTAMLNRAFRESALGEPTLSHMELMNLLFGHSDEGVIRWLAGRGDICGEIMQLLDERRLYKRLLVIHKPLSATLFEMLDRIKWDERYDFDRLQESFVEQINRRGLLAGLHRSPLQPHDILLDVPHRRSGLDNVVILREHDDRFIDDGEPVNVWNGIRQDFERWTRKIRVFCHPTLKASLNDSKSKTSENANLSERLMNLLSECAWRELQQPIGR